jgi:peptidase S41-like protein
MRQNFLLLVGFAVLGLLAAKASPGFDAKPFDAKPWIADLDQARETFLTKYANLEWAVFQREADLPQLFADTEARIRRATNDWEARSAFERLARKLGDGHVVFDWPRSGGHGMPAASAPQEQCTALGYDPRMRAVPLAANSVGYQALSTPQSGEFPAGVISLGSRRIGVLQIGVFTPQGFPALCQSALRELAITADKPCDDACSDRIEAWASDQLTRDLAAQLRALKDAGAEVLVVDVAGNGGGSEWAEAVARMVTPIRLRSEEMEFVRGEHWAKSFADDEASLRRFADQANGPDRALLLKLADEVEARRKVALTPCDSAPMWQGAHPACSWLGRGFYGSGLLAWADPSQLKGKPWATLLFTPMEFPYEEGVWTGPVIVLVDRNTGSAASEFAALLQDNHAAIIMGEPAGAGCGHTNGGTPTTLANSKATLEVPDCARVRADGSNEVMGIQPDVAVAFSGVDGAHLRGARFMAQLPEAVERAAGLRK